MWFLTGQTSTFLPTDYWTGISTTAGTTIRRCRGNNVNFQATLSAGQSYTFFFFNTTASTITISTGGQLEPLTTTLALAIWHRQLKLCIIEKKLSCILSCFSECMSVSKCYSECLSECINKEKPSTTQHHNHTERSCCHTCNLFSKRKSKHHEPKRSKGEGQCFD